MTDLCIRAAWLFDGTGAAPNVRDVHVAAGRIVAITPVGHDAAPARESVDATGLALMPGISDSHTHFDLDAIG